jgi:hypothetical protein
MDHTYIEENQVAERYVAGTLPEAERERFEDHYLSCQECLDRLEVAESLQRGFKRMAGQDAAALSAARQLAVVAWLSRLSRSRQISSLLAAVLILAVLPAGLAWRGAAERGRELAQVRSELEHERQRPAASAGSTAEAEKLRAELEASQRERASEHEQLAQALQPQGNVPIVSLDVERGAGLPGTEPTNRLPQPAAGRIDFELPVDPPLKKSYRAILRDSQGREIARVEDLHPGKRDSLTLSLPASLTPPGDYTLSIDGLMSGGKSISAGRFPFRILPPA